MKQRHAQGILQSSRHILDDDRSIEWGRSLEFADAFFVFRIILGRNPSDDELAWLSSMVGSVTAREFLATLLDLPEYRYQTRFIPPGYELLSDLNGFLFRFRTDDRDMGIPMALGIYEPAVSKIVRSLAPHCQTMVDAGANTGYITCTFLEAAPQSAKVIAFEPMPENIKLFWKNMQLNGFDSRVNLHRAACGCKSGKVTMSSVSKMMISCEIDGSPTSEIDVVALDDVVHESVDVVKLDVEGAEPIALEGMSRIISESRPILITEINDYWLRKVGGSSSQEYVAQLESLGYRLIPASSYARGVEENLVLPEDDPLFVIEVVCHPV